MTARHSSGKAVPGKVDQRAARSMNRWLVLDLLRRAGPLSRTRIASGTGLSPASITAVTGDLLGEGLLIEHPELAAQLPRRAVPLGVNYAGHHAVGMKLQDRELLAARTDLNLNVQARARVPLSGHSPEDVVAAAQHALAQLAPRSGELVGVGLALPGLIDSASGVVSAAHRLGWEGVPLGALLANALGLPSFIDNDANAFATAERLVGRARQAGDFVVVTLGRGVGAALVVGGQLQRGPGGAAGELGHVLSEPGGRPCECGLRGCLQAQVSTPDLLAQHLAAHPEAAGLSEAEFRARAAAGDPAFAPLLAEAGARVGRALADLRALLGSPLVIVGGEGAALGEALLTPLRDALEERRLPGTPVPTVLVHRWDDDAWARGAAGLVAEYFFQRRAPEPTLKEA